MKAWLLDAYTGIKSIRLADTPNPVPGPGEVLLQVLYAGLNPADSYLAIHQYPAKPTFPHILGRDAVGVAVAVGTGVQGIELGGKYCLIRGVAGGDRPGTFAQLVAVPADCLIPKPGQWTDEEAAGAVLVYLTAYQALTLWGPLKRDAAVLVTGASGGVGLASIQLGKALGYNVFALSRDPEKHTRLLECGAVAAYSPEFSDWRHSVKGLLHPGGIDLAIDNIGGTLLPEVISTLGNQAKVSLVGRLAGPVPDFNTATLFFRRIQMGGVAVGAYTTAEAREAWGHVLELLSRIGAKPIVDSAFPFNDLPNAFERLHKGPFGKVLLRVA